MHVKLHEKIQIYQHGCFSDSPMACSPVPVTFGNYPPLQSLRRSDFPPLVQVKAPYLPNRPVFEQSPEYLVRLCFRSDGLGEVCRFLSGLATEEAVDGAQISVSLLIRGPYCRVHVAWEMLR